MKLTAILLAFYIFLGSLFPGTDYGQFLRISDLVQHIQVHRLEAAEAQDIAGQHAVARRAVDPAEIPRGCVHRREDAGASAGEQTIPEWRVFSILEGEAG